MRIIGGKFKSRVLKTLKGDNTRPTADKVKGAIFSSIAFETNYNRMLDLFAGSGAMGIEALSRGFKYAYFNDKNKQAANIIKANLANLNLKAVSMVYNIDYQQCLSLLSKKEQIDFVFIDPPYNEIEISDILASVNKYDIVAPDGIVCVETANTLFLQASYGKLVKYKEKNYKACNITYYKKQG